MEIKQLLRKHFSDRGIRVLEKSNLCHIVWPEECGNFRKGWKVVCGNTKGLLILQLPLKAGEADMIMEAWNRSNLADSGVVLASSPLPGLRAGLSFRKTVSFDEATFLETFEQTFASIATVTVQTWKHAEGLSCATESAFDRTDLELFMAMLGYEEMEVEGDKVFGKVRRSIALDDLDQILSSDAENFLGDVTVEAKLPDGWVRGEGKGFADVAGMDELKTRLTREVLWPITHRTEAEAYRVTPPNGMLLYGPPGCGKTFFAQKLAEESGLAFKVFYPSSLGSVYVHGSQGAIARMFDEARQAAPCIICLDEVDALIPERSDSPGSTNINGEVNEFLSQLNNCSKDGVFVVGTTNRRSLIDPAALRKGRLDIQVQISAPDEEMRKKLFDVCLKDRPTSDDVDTAALAAKTEGFTPADVAYAVNNAALDAAMAGLPICMEMLEQALVKCEVKAKKPERKKIGYAV